MGVDARMVIGRDAEGRRFVANTPRDGAILRDAGAAGQIGRRNLLAPE